MLCTSYSLFCFSFLNFSFCPTANVTLDPYTAGCWLFLSEDHKSVRLRDELPDLLDNPDNPERFSNQFCILGLEGFTRGRHFWEVVVEGEGNWFMGVARKSVRRKDPVCIGPEGGIWAVGKWMDRHSLSINPLSSALSLSRKAKRVRVCLNFAANQVAFYNADTGDQIHIFSEVPFSGETVLPFFYVDIKCNLRISSSNSQAHL
ncbi:butyrophilin subfamily 3 member A1-like [Anolis sagrei]|uniref:butyrophilin subfamily 3 member A1-like n=1 Tax=Anolis sagrei TaxID=38937 RepID=UPI003522C475